MPKAASKLAAAPSTPLARISKTPVTVHNSSVPTTSLPIASTEARGQSLILEPMKRETETIFYCQMARTNRIQKSDNLASKSMSLILRYVPEPLCYGLVKLGVLTSIDELIASASLARRPTPDFENLDFQIASGLRQILTGNAKKQVTTAEGKAQSEMGSLPGKQIAWLICNIFKISGDNGAILNFRHLSKVRPSTQNVSKCHQQSQTDQLTAYWRVCTRCRLNPRKN